MKSVNTCGNFAVLLTNDLTSHYVNSVESILKPEGGEDFHHRIHQRILLVKENECQIVALVQKNFINGPSLIKLKITVNGIEDS